MESKYRASYAADLFFQSRVFPEGFLDSCAGFRGDTLVKWVHVTKACAISGTHTTWPAPSHDPSAPLGGSGWHADSRSEAEVPWSVGSSPSGQVSPALLLNTQGHSQGPLSWDPSVGTSGPHAGPMDVLLVGAESHLVTEAEPGVGGGPRIGASGIKTIGWDGKKGCLLLVQYL